MPRPPHADSKFVEDLVRDRVDLAAVGFDGEVGDLAIKRVAGRHQRFEDGPGVIVGEQRSFAASPGTRQLLIDARMQVDHEAPRAEVIAVLWIHDNATARREYYAITFRQVVDCLRLALAKAFFALFLEDKRNVDTGPSFDLLVAIDEVEMQQTRELAADRRLAGPHRAYQKYVSGFFHSRDSLLNYRFRSASGQLSKLSPK